MREAKGLGIYFVNCPIRADGWNPGNEFQSQEKAFRRKKETDLGKTKQTNKKSQEVKEKEFLKGTEVPESMSCPVHCEVNFP